jgi:hypothetical protein
LKEIRDTKNYAEVGRRENPCLGSKDQRVFRGKGHGQFRKPGSWGETLVPAIAEQSFIPLAVIAEILVFEAIVGAIGTLERLYFVGSDPPRFQTRG